jgi:hypothetical protein
MDVLLLVFAVLGGFAVGLVVGCFAMWFLLKEV